VASSINDKTITDRLNRDLRQAKAREADSLSKLSSGSVFTSQSPKPAERALAEKMEFRLRSLSSAKLIFNDAVSLLQTAESSLSEINNIVTRMKEINVTGASTTVSDQERRFLFIEYQALFDEMNRIAITTEFNGIPLLNGKSPKTPEELIFRLDDAISGDYPDINTITMTGLKAINATPVGLGIQSAIDLLRDTTSSEGISLRDVAELLEPSDSDEFSTIYDEAINLLSTKRAVFGSLQSRLNTSMDFIDVYQENIAAAKSKIADTDYAEEVANLVRNKISIASTTSLLAQSNLSTNVAFQLIKSLS
jgi:flagellin